ncbi:hypothetical protein GCM10025875_20420 [Litorihabitans aurantiacus]|uniref:Uncharacterized protein n=1 Tax=Litorihabitans aurantiacus TaxID=1930061 RepID=A0AA38CUC9_9MICO|nr:hypothetical protein GCM10025875_20420 [Litorihabitans aurantiacus]
MRHQYDGEAGLGLDAAQLGAHVDAEPRVEVGQRLVEQQQLRADRDGAGERDALLLAAGELLRAAAGQVAEADEVERLLDDAPALRRADLAQLEPVADVLGHGHVREERVGLEDHAEAAALGRGARGVDAVDEDRARRRDGVAREHAQRRRLAAAARSEQRGELPGGDGEVDRVDGGEVAEALGHLLELRGDGHRLIPPKMRAKPTVRSATTATSTVPARMMVLVAATMGS